MNHTTTGRGRAGRPRSVDGERLDRRLELVRAAYQIIARHGLEHLRTRGVAEAAAINVATLHYYFPTKESLIAAVASHLATLFDTRAETRGGVGALQALRQEFADMRDYLADRPEMIQVMFELNARARRDRRIARIIEPLKASWRGTIERVVAGGVAEGVFRSDLNTAHVAGAIVAALWGAATLPLSCGEREGLFAVIEAWLRPSGAKRRKTGSRTGRRGSRS
ncbi:MAG TPA: TetR/AcrR family transcriptional regulator [Vicinamibacterales bacterium]